MTNGSGLGLPGRRDIASAVETDLRDLVALSIEVRARSAELRRRSREAIVRREGRDIIVVGASRGGVQALTELVGSLPADLAAAIFVVAHMPPCWASRLPKILSREGPLPAEHAYDLQPIVRGRIYVAPPDHHLLVRVGHMRLSQEPPENFVRPAADALFRSAANAYGPRVVGVVLSGMLVDGTLGVGAIQASGGVTIVQDPDDALAPGMPASAILNGHVDHSLPVREMAAALASVGVRRRHAQFAETCPAT